MTMRITWLAAGQWAALTLLGVLLAGGFHFPGDFGSTHWSQVNVGFGAGLMGFVFGGVSGLMIAGLQALVLRAWGRPARAWLVFNAAGYGLVHAMADGVPYRPLVIVAGALIVALSQFLALQPVLTKPAVWLPVAAGAWWLGFGLTAGVAGYNLLVVGLLQGVATGLALRLLFLPNARPETIRRSWDRMDRAQKVRLGLMAALGSVLALVFGVLMGVIRL